MNIVTLPRDSIIEEILYHPHNFFLKCTNRLSSNGFVNMSAVCSFVSIEWIEMNPLSTCCLKWWYLMAMCFVLGENLPFLANDNAPSLSSQTLQWTSGVGVWIGNMVLISLSNCINGITSLNDWLNAKYSASTVDNAISVWSLLHHCTRGNLYW